MQQKLSELRDRPDALRARLRLPKLAEQIRPMRAFLAVALHGSTVRAAQAIHLSQPAVTRAVKVLEAECGLALFDRATRGMALTEAGSRLAARAKTVFFQLSCGGSEALAAAPADARTVAPPERFAAVIAAAPLRALVVIASQGSEAAAASVLGVTQPAVHHALQGLEHTLGVRLFYRLSFGTRLTPAGEALLRRVQLAMAEIQAMEGDIALLRGEVRGRVVVGVLPLSVSIFLPRAIESLLGRHPEIAVEIVDGTYESLVRQLSSAAIDVIAGALRPGRPNDELAQHALFDDDLVVVARAGHPSLGTPLALGDLLRWDWVTPLPDTPAERVLDRVFENQGHVPPRKTLRASSPASTLALVMQTGRLALASRGEAQVDDRGGELCIVPVELPATQRRIGLVTRGTGRPSHDLALLIEACREAVGVPSGAATDRALGDSTSPVSSTA